MKFNFSTRSAALLLLCAIGTIPSRAVTPAGLSASLFDVRSPLIPVGCRTGAVPASEPEETGARDYTLQYYMIPMSDGVRLNTVVATPASGSGPWPVLLYRTPYNIEITNVNWVADAGYIGVSQDTRGRFGSEGLDRMFRDDGWGPDNRDGLETVQWILEQPWFGGRIATYGGSACGITQNLLAAALPESVRCMIVSIAAADIYDDLVFPGGAFKQIDIETWLRNQGSEHMIDSIYVHPNHDAWWRWLDTTSRHALETVPTYQLGGWFDIFPEGPIHSFTGLQFGGGPGAAGNQKLIMGPWIHGSDGGEQGELYFPDAWCDNAQALVGTLVDWLNYWIFDAPNGIMSRPPIAYYLMGDASTASAPGNEWRTTDIWPPPSVTVGLHLRSAGALSLTPPLTTEPPETYAYDPLHPVPTLGGGNLVIPAGPYDQRPVLNRPDVLVYQTPVLAEPWEITGSVGVELYASSDCLDTDFTAKLCDVYPDGRVMLVTDGILRARHRLRMDGEDLLVPGEVVRLTIGLSETAIVFNAGHRILVAVSSSNAPRFDVNPNTGEPFMQQTTTLVAHNTVYHEPGYPSRLLLPLTGDMPTGIEIPDAAEASAGHIRLTAGPNPFVDRTRLRFVLSGARRVELRVLDPSGRRVRTLVNGDYPPGEHEVLWDGRDEAGHAAPNGVFRVLLRSARESQARTITRIR